MDILIKTARAYPHTCIGCLRHQRAVMITLTHETGPDHFYNHFLNREEAILLHEELGRAIQALPPSDTSAAPSSPQG